MKYFFSIVALLALWSALAPLRTAAQMTDQPTAAPYASRAANAMQSTSPAPTASPVFGETPPPEQTTVTTTETPGNAGYWGLLGLLGLLGLMGLRNRTKP